MPQQSKVERLIVSEIEEDQEEKRKRREFRENQQARAERKRLRQEEKLRLQKEVKAKREARRKQRETQSSVPNRVERERSPSGAEGSGDGGHEVRSDVMPGDTSITIKSDTDSRRQLLRTNTTVSGISFATSDASDNLPDSDDDESVRAGFNRKPPSQLSRQASRHSLSARATTMSMTEDGVAAKKSKSSITGAISGGLRTTGTKFLRTGTTIGLLLGVVPSKSSRDFLRKKVSKLFPGRSKGRRKSDDKDATDDDAASEDSEAEQIKEIRRRFKEKQLRSSASLEGASDNILARAREAVGIPEEEEEYTCWLRLQKKTGILWFRMQLAVRKIAIGDHPPHPGLKRFVESLRFEAAIGALIVVNGIISGMDAMYKPGEERPSLISVSEHVFVAIFVMEYFLRLRAATWVWMFEPMNMFDTFVVWITGVLVVWILEPLGIDFDPLRRLAALRVLRLGRLARAVRTMPMFKELWMLVSGVLECTRLLFWSIVIIAIVHFMFAVAVMETITKSDIFQGEDPADLDVQRYFGTLSYSMFTLFQFMTFDSWALRARPIMFKMPEAAALFILFLGVAGIVLFNLMTAIVVKNAFDAAEADEEAKAQQQVHQQAMMQADLRTMFQALDEDGSGTLTREEFTDVLDDIMFIRQMKVLDIDLEELPEIFDILDDGDGEITTEEFCTGVTRLQGFAMSREMMRCTNRNQELNRKFAQVSHCMGEKVNHTLHMTEMSMEATHENLVELQQMTAEVLLKLEEAGLHRAVRSSTKTLEDLVSVSTPTLEDIAQQEEDASRKKSLGRATGAKAHQSRSTAMEPEGRFMEGQHRGVIKEFYKEKGYGLVASDELMDTLGKDLPFKKEDFDSTAVGTAVLFVAFRERGPDADGRLRARQVGFPRIAPQWVLTREKDREQRKQALRTQQWEDVAADTVKEIQELPGVLQEFRETWSSLEVQVPQQTREDRLAAAIQASVAKASKTEDKKGVEVEKKLPAKLPSSLAPRTVLQQEQEADGQDPATEEADTGEKVGKDINKMNIKELKEVAESLGMENYEGLKKVQLLPLILAKQEEVANAGKAALSMM
mmetsp:Transcript_7988/g.18542  ORF Transcript_7988/g.18542 Transcript_7988/m.18542 type:complete len:1070 (+) Transcript_7988:77-3286(+)